jgi:hypothetical protein
MLNVLIGIHIVFGISTLLYCLYSVKAAFAGRVNFDHFVKVISKTALASILTGTMVVLIQFSAGTFIRFCLSLFFYLLFILSSTGLLYYKSKGLERKALQDRS